MCVGKFSPENLFSSWKFWTVSWVVNGGQQTSEWTNERTIQLQQRLCTDDNMLILCLYYLQPLVGISTLPLHHRCCYCWCRNYPAPLIHRWCCWQCTHIFRKSQAKPNQTTATHVSLWHNVALVQRPHIMNSNIHDTTRHDTTRHGTHSKQNIYLQQ